MVGVPAEILTDHLPNMVNGATAALTRSVQLSVTVIPKGRLMDTWK
jgi:hypothetical protein